MSRFSCSWLVALFAVVAAAGCQERDAPLTVAKRFGEQMFADPRLADSEFNIFACSTCHSTRPGEPARYLPGGSLHDVVRRERFFGGYETSLLDAVNFCYVYFMRGLRGLAADDPRGKALYEYLASLTGTQPAPPVPMTIVHHVSDIPRGDATRGSAVYTRACANCHGAADTGAGKIGLDAPTLPNITRSYRQDFPGVEPSLVVIEKVRHGQFFGIGGNMPFFTREVLSDEELGAVLAFLRL